MRTKNLPLALALVLSSCVRSPSSPAAPIEDDKTIVFPAFFSRAAKAVGAEGETYELDGETLRAVAIAANDFLPPGDKPRSCPNRQEAYFYRVIRQGSIVFVYIYQNPEYCGPEHLMLDSGAKYAISTDGRILRRILDGQPDGPGSLETGDDGGIGVSPRPGVTPAYDTIWNHPSSTEPQEVRDGGLPWPPDGGPADAGP